MPELPEVGGEFAGYRLLSVIGRGAMSVVYEAEHPRFGQGIALKVLAAEVSADDIFRTRFLQESRIAASMDHPHVIGVYDVGEGDGLLYVAMRRVFGGDLRQRIGKRGPLPPATAVALLSQAAEALDSAHRMGLVHRDVKPENLLIEGDDEGGAERLYVADFGISKLGMTRNGLTSTGHFLGTVAYVAPEQISEPYVYGSADQYSLGCVLYECLTGRVPFEKVPGADPGLASGHSQRSGLALLAELPPAAQAMFARVLAERPGDRYNTCREFMESAGVALADLATALVPSDDSYTIQASPEGAGYSSAAAATATSVAPVQASTPVPVPAATAGSYAAAPDSYQPRSEPRSADYVAPEAAGDGREPTPEVPALAEGDGGSSGGRRRARWLVIAAVLLLACAGGGGAYAALSSHPKAAVAMPSAMPSTPMPVRTTASPLEQVLTAANHSRVAMGMLPPSSCSQRSMTRVVCTAPSASISRVSFTTYPTLTALYSAYKAEVRSLHSGRYRQNVQDCGLSAPNPYGELAWNHREQHSRAYSIKEMISGKVSVETAMGRMACMATAGHSEDIVWTTDFGKMLGVAIGSGSHARVWLWWVGVHHNIIFPGTPMDMGGSAPLMSGAPTPKTSASASPSMMASATPSMAKSGG